MILNSASWSVMLGLTEHTFLTSKIPSGALSKRTVMTLCSPGAYVVTETKAPAGYVMDSPSTNVVIGANGDTQTIITYPRH